MDTGTLLIILWASSQNRATDTTHVIGGDAVEFEIRTV